MRVELGPHLVGCSICIHETLKGRCQARTSPLRDAPAGGDRAEEFAAGRGGVGAKRIRDIAAPLECAARAPGDVSRRAAALERMPHGLPRAQFSGDRGNGLANPRSVAACPAMSRYPSVDRLPGTSA